MASKKQSNQPAGKGKVKTRAKDTGPARLGGKVKIFNWSEIEYRCPTCDRKHGKTQMVVMHKGEYYCNWECSGQSGE